MLKGNSGEGCDPLLSSTCGKEPLAPRVGNRKIIVQFSECTIWSCLMKGPNINVPWRTLKLFLNNLNCFECNNRPLRCAASLLQACCLAIIKPLGGCVHMACSSLVITSLLQVVNLLRATSFFTRLKHVVSTTCSKSANVQLMQLDEANTA